MELPNAFDDTRAFKIEPSQKHYYQKRWDNRSDISRDWRNILNEIRENYRSMGVEPKTCSALAWRDGIRRWEADSEEAPKSRRQIAEDIDSRLPKADLRRSPLPNIVAFALANMHKIPDPYNPQTWVRGFGPEDAPNPEAWNMLILAASEPRSFMNIVTKEIVHWTRKTGDQKVQFDDHGSGGSDDNDDGISQLDDMLRKVGGNEDDRGVPAEVERAPATQEGGAAAD